MAREFIYFGLESSFGVPVTPLAAQIWTTTGTGSTTGPNVAGFAGFYGRLDGGDSFTMRPAPVPVSVPYGGGLATRAFTVSDKQDVKGTYKTKLYAGPYAQFLLQWAVQQINSGGYVGGAGVVTGWSYTGRAGDLASVTIVHAIQMDDGTYAVRQYPGVKVAKWTLEISSQSQIGELTLDLVGSSACGNPFNYGNYVDPTLQTFTGPGATPPTWGSTSTASTVSFPGTPNLPVNPHLFVDLGSGVTIGSARGAFESIHLTGDNHIARRWWANRFVQTQLFCGRTVSLTCENYYKHLTPSDRSQFESMTPQAASIEFNNGTHTITLTLNANNVITTLTDVLPLDNIYTQRLELASQWDPAYAQTDQALGADLEIAFT
jgi:hypothetical protein